MSLKSIFNVFVFGTAFVVSSFVAYLFMPIPSPQPFVVTERSSCHKKQYLYKSQTGLNILELLKEDISNGVERTLGYRSPREKAKSVEIYVDASSTMSVSHLPREFQIAWKKHMQAWKNYSAYLNQSVKNGKTINENADYGKVGELNAEINSTWQDVLDIGENYYEGLRMEID
jgi:hypothetical protein